MWDRDADGDIDSTEAIVHVSIDGTRDAVDPTRLDADQMTVFRYDDRDRRVEMEMVHPPVSYGSPKSARYTYDSRGLRVRERVTDGPPDMDLNPVVRLHSYECRPE
ncbi:MAG: hypothetical protein ABEN55_14025 [Bradymonadaceae bacterium]